ncbi:tRNA 2-thiouridine(34) synthase MnmA [uncultured Campylobacter sp.]|uniref:tRNA 2-thiouridine(34) synthase MnmA n=1 Tax=uncultured Campylobacter sp. TaxID=218934 RepID=UPI00262611D5|nr:tRNA 2-thiouridine(34) synthase MnmA [uncultured Campylobacter sp.]
MKVLVAMSGGIDSTVCVKLLKEAGHEVVGCYMKLHQKEGYHEKNIKNVELVGKFFGIKTTVLDLEDEFKKFVYDPFVNIYKEGKTPNPCVYCNKKIKLGALLNYALENGFERLATGHYARVENGLIKAAKDESKDQSYFLANIDKSAISHMIFPLGNLYKKEIREMIGGYCELLDITSQKESSEICFVENSYIEILNRHFNTQKPGLVKDTNGNIIGTHKGYMHYTIGKRRGFTLNCAHEPHYILEINAQNNELIVGTKEELRVSEFHISNLNTFTKLSSKFNAFVKIRYKSPMLMATVDKEELKVSLKEPVYGVAKGQLAVFYDEEKRVLASGFIA